jgi:hypothetical protein
VPPQPHFTTLLPFGAGMVTVEASKQSLLFLDAASVQVSEWLLDLGSIVDIVVAGDDIFLLHNVASLAPLAGSGLSGAPPPSSVSAAPTPPIGGAASAVTPLPPSAAAVGGIEEIMDISCIRCVPYSVYLRYLAFESPEASIPTSSSLSDLQRMIRLVVTHKIDEREITENLAKRLADYRSNVDQEGEPGARPEGVTAASAVPVAGGGPPAAPVDAKSAEEWSKLTIEFDRMVDTSRRAHAALLAAQEAAAVAAIAAAAEKKEREAAATAAALAAQQAAAAASVTAPASTPPVAPTSTPSPVASSRGLDGTLSSSGGGGASDGNSVQPSSRPNQSTQPTLVSPSQSMASSLSSAMGAFPAASVSLTSPVSTSATPSSAPVIEPTKRPTSFTASVMKAVAAVAKDIKSSSSQSSSTSISSDKDKERNSGGMASGNVGGATADGRPRHLEPAFNGSFAAATVAVTPPTAGVEKIKKRKATKIRVIDIAVPSPKPGDPLSPSNSGTPSTAATPLVSVGGSGVVNVDGASSLIDHPLTHVADAPEIKGDIKSDMSSPTAASASAATGLVGSKAGKVKKSGAKKSGISRSRSSNSSLATIAVAATSGAGATNEGAVTPASIVDPSAPKPKRGKKGTKAKGILSSNSAPSTPSNEATSTVATITESPSAPSAASSITSTPVHSTSPTPTDTPSTSPVKSTIGVVGENKEDKRSGSEKKDVTENVLVISAAKKAMNDETKRAADVAAARIIRDRGALIMELSSALWSISSPSLVCGTLNDWQQWSEWSRWSSSDDLRPLISIAHCIRSSHASLTRFKSLHYGSVEPLLASSSSSIPLMVPILPSSSPSSLSSPPVPVLTLLLPFLEIWFEKFQAVVNVVPVPASLLLPSSAPSIASNDSLQRFRLQLRHIATILAPSSSSSAASPAASPLSSPSLHSFGRVQINQSICDFLFVCCYSS